MKIISASAKKCSRCRTSSLRGGGRGEKRNSEIDLWGHERIREQSDDGIAYEYAQYAGVIRKSLDGKRVN